MYVRYCFVGCWLERIYVAVDVLWLRVALLGWSRCVHVLVIGVRVSLGDVGKSYFSSHGCALYSVYHEITSDSVAVS